MQPCRALPARHWHCVAEKPAAHRLMRSLCCLQGRTASRAWTCARCRVPGRAASAARATTGPSGCATSLLCCCRSRPALRCARPAIWPWCDPSGTRCVETAGLLRQKRAVLYITAATVAAEIAGDWEVSTGVCVQRGWSRTIQSYTGCILREAVTAGRGQPLRLRCVLTMESGCRCSQAWRASCSLRAS